ncbi:MAG TPA: hypothetical protein PKC24_01515, partial [Cyclobacteriaceae bacterium]|nr:hypothetical protein [Cyclobacteriaceae bacterium]
LGTIRGGVVFLNPNTGETVQILNYFSGLPDNEVMTINADRESSVWIAHQYGFTRIMPDLPIRSYNHYPGLEGKILSAQTFNQKIYVGTSLGLYSLEKTELFDEYIDYVRVVQNTSAGNSTKQSEEVKLEEPVQEDVKALRKRGFLGFLKKNKIDDEAPEEESEKKAQPQPKAQPSTRIVMQKRVNRELRAIEYEYKQVEGVNAKVTQLISAKDNLFAAGLDGLHIINASGKLEKKLTGQPIRYAYYYEAEEVIFAATYQNEILSFEKINNIWRPSNIFDDFKEYVLHIFSDKQGRVWFSGLDRVYWIYLKNLSVLDMDEIVFDNPYFEQTYGIQAKDSIYFVNADHLLLYVDEQNKLVQSQQNINPIRVLIDSDEIWILTERGWSNLQLTSSGLAPKNFLNVFQGISHINRDSNSDEIWIITSDEELYRYNTLLSFEKDITFPLILKRVSLQDQLVSLNSRYSIEQQEGGMSISFVQPDFSGLTPIEYRYRLKGTGNDWSPWSIVNNRINITFLPVGDYELLIESRDAFGIISSAEPIFINIEPPYWRQLWFYAIEVAVFLILVLLSIRLGRYGQRYRIVSRLLTFLTIVIFIEFIQTLAEEQFATETSPVIDFLIQVSVAFMILPIESYLRKLMLRQNVKTLDLSFSMKGLKEKKKSETE